MYTLNLRTPAATVAAAALLGAMISLWSSQAPTAAAVADAGTKPASCAKTCESMTWLRQPALHRVSR
jgi:hypothetical protein